MHIAIYISVLVINPNRDNWSDLLINNWAFLSSEYANFLLTKNISIRPGIIKIRWILGKISRAKGASIDAIVNNKITQATILVFSTPIRMASV